MISRLIRLALVVPVALYAAAVQAAGTCSSHPQVRLILLGTQAGPVPGVWRSQPASLLLVGGRPYLIDAGEGVSRQIAAAGYQPAGIRTILITHHHVDHNAGLGPLMSFIWFGGGDGNDAQTQIYGPPATAYLVRTALQYLSVSERIFRAGMPHHPKAAPMFAAHDIAHDGVVFRDDCVTVSAAENSHFAHPSYGPTGARDRSYSYRFDTKGGSVVFTGDTGPSAAVTRLARGADLLVSEVNVQQPVKGGRNAPDALTREGEEHMRREHLTPFQVGEMARAAHVRTVILTHIAGGLSGPNGIAAQVKQRFPGTVIEGTDLMRYVVGN